MSAPPGLLGNLWERLPTACAVGYWYDRPLGGLIEPSI